MASIHNSNHRPRELRRRVVLPARIRQGAAWFDGCILNISSRGLMVQASRGICPGTEIQLHRGHHIIPAKVVWRKGTKLGLQVDERLPVEDIMSIGQVPRLQLTAGGTVAMERRHGPRTIDPSRTNDSSRTKGRAIEFVGVALIAGSLTGAALIMVQEAFARPMEMIEQALGS